MRAWTCSASRVLPSPCSKLQLTHVSLPPASPSSTGGTFMDDPLHSWNLFALLAWLPGDCSATRCGLAAPGSYFSGAAVRWWVWVGVGLGGWGRVGFVWGGMRWAHCDIVYVVLHASRVHCQVRARRASRALLSSTYPIYYSCVEEIAPHTTGRGGLARGQ